MLRSDKKVINNKKARIEFIKAMETIARAVNDEEVFETWLVDGIADGDIKEDTPDDELEYYVDNEKFADVMDTFLFVMKHAYEDGGLYFDDVLSCPR